MSDNKRFSDLPAGTPPYDPDFLAALSRPTGGSPPFESVNALLSDVNAVGIANLPSVDLDFVNAIYWAGPYNPPNPLTVSRASVGYIDTVAGVWSSVAANILRRSDRGALIEEARTNTVRNNSMQGVVDGSPGTVPTNWLVATPTGLTQTISHGTTDGIEWVEFNFAGTASSTAAIVIYHDGSGGTAASEGQIWTSSSWASVAIATGVTLVVQGTNFAAGAGSANSPNFFDDTNFLRRKITATAGSGTTVCRTIIQTNSIASSTVVDLTIRTGWPQLEIGNGASSPIRTTTAAATRSADVVSVTLPPLVDVAHSIDGRGTPTAPVAYATAQYLASISDGSSSDRFAIARAATTGIPSWVLNATLTAIGASAWAVDTEGKVAAANAVSSQAGCFNAGTITDGSSASAPVGMTTMQIGADGTGASQFNGYIENIRIWPSSRLSNVSLFGLTGSQPGANGFVSAAKSTAQAAPSDPTGTTNTTGVMMGLAGSFTPTRSGAALIVISGTIFNATAIGDGAKTQIRYGTGTAPANAAALTGTAVGNLVQYVAATTAEKAPFSVNAIVTGLTRLTTYWIDLSLAAITAGTASLSDISISVVEL